jgi:hypothetical protein
LIRDANVAAQGDFVSGLMPLSPCAHLAEARVP